MSIMPCMYSPRISSFLLMLACSAAPALATPEAMNKALADWRQEVGEYEAALEHAVTPEQKAAIPAPYADRIADALWRSISAKTGQKEETVQPTAEERLRGEKAKLKKRNTYEFEEDWAAPAVVWFALHPDSLAKLYEGKPRQLSYFADALLTAIEKKHYLNPAITEAIAKLAESPSERVYGIMERIFTHNGDPSARGCAALAMSIMLNNPLISAEAGSPAMARAKRIYYLKQAIALTTDSTRFGNALLSDVVLEQSYLLRYLSPGCVPPQVHVTNAQGEVATLPERGKPTLILFWHPGDPMSTDIARRLPSLATKYPGLVLAAITAAGEGEEMARGLAESGVEATFSDDAQNSASTAYRVAQLPTIAFINDRSELLYIGYPDLHLQSAMDSYFNNQGRREHGPVTIREAEPVIQPGSQPVPAQPTEQQPSDTAPALREMPEF